MKEKKGIRNKSMLLFFLKMVVLFIIFAEFIIDQILVNGAMLGISNYKYGIEFLMEGLRAVFILVVLLLFGNGYIFKEKRERFIDSIFLGWPILILSVVNLFDSIRNIGGQHVNPNVIINLVAFCIMIGIFEEFLCRGWIQNEFIERFKKDKNQVIKSIFLASLVFGVMHISNVWTSNQGLFFTILQIVQALSAGILFGSIYYKTKNIWSVVFLHGFYDFSLFLGEAHLIRDCETGILNNGVTAYSIFSTILIIVLYCITAALVLRSNLGERKLHINEVEEDKNRKLFITSLLIIAILLLPVHIKGEEDSEICFHYPEKEMSEKYTISRITTNDNYYELSNENTTIILSFDEEEKKFYLKNGFDYITFDQEFYKHYVLENNTYYEIVLLERDANESSMYYTRIQKEDLKSGKDYLKEIRNSLKKYDLPAIGNIGFIEFNHNQQKYIYLQGQFSEFYINEKGILYLLKEEE